MLRASPNVLGWAPHLPCAATPTTVSGAQSWWVSEDVALGFLNKNPTQVPLPALGPRGLSPCGTLTVDIWSSTNITNCYPDAASFQQNTTMQLEGTWDRKLPEREASPS